MTTAGYKIRRASLADLGAIQTLARDFCTYEKVNFDPTIDVDAPFSKEETEFFTSSLTSEDCFIIVAEVDTKVIGYLFATAKGKQDYRTVSTLAEVNHVYVKEEYQGKGIGKAFSQEFENWCRSKNIEFVRATTYVKNQSAVEFYEAQGFEKYGLVLEKKLL
jgi:ribosomal protein S18 acetylase RimI-like enzyme